MALSLVPGLALTDARARHPALHVVEADPLADNTLMEHVAAWSEGFTPLVARDGADRLYLDITGCAHLFGGERAMLAHIRTRLVKQGFHTQIAIAGTALAARALAHEADGTIAVPNEDHTAVAPLPITALAAEPAIIHALRRAGLMTIGDVAHRASAELTARFGASFTFMLDQTLGRRNHPISPRRPLPDFIVERRFADPVSTHDVILQTLTALAATLEQTMEPQGKGARGMEAAFFRSDGTVRTTAIAMSEPTRDPAVIIRLFRDRIETLRDPLDPGFGFDLIRLAVSDCEHRPAAQSDFQSASGTDKDIAMLIDRLAARFGRHRILRYQPQDTYIPEYEALAVPAQQTQVAPMVWPERRTHEPPRRPIRLFERHEPVDVMAEVPDGPPLRFRWRRALHKVVRAEGPERIAMEWWRIGDEILSRDYFRIEDERGLRFWIYRESPFGSENTGAGSRWFVHGLFA